MGVHTYVVGIRPADAEFERMRKVYESCLQANVMIPGVVEEFFEWQPPDDKGVLIDLGGYACRKEYSKDNSNGIEIDLEKLPKDIKIIRFINSY